MLKALAPMQTLRSSSGQQKSAALGGQTEEIEMKNGNLEAIIPEEDTPALTNNLVERLVRGLATKCSTVGMFFVQKVVAMRVRREKDFYNYPLDVKNSSVSVDKEGTLSAVLARSFCVEDLDSDDPVSTHVTIRDDNVDIKIMTAVDVPGPP
eukprot:GHVS01015927.1.p2 GENE.GHVS01015927.1~~GHVS01015927.1.p2  ORF type:complete len:152 (+),score=23.68 GHVS01015927.1:1000-1455(+)